MDDRYVHKNIGLIEVTIDEASPLQSSVKLAILGEDNREHLVRHFRLSEMIFDYQPKEYYSECMGQFGSAFWRFANNYFDKVVKKGEIFGFFVFLVNISLPFGGIFFLLSLVRGLFSKIFRVFLG
jgi:hypothetical protein